MSDTPRTDALIARRGAVFGPTYFNEFVDFARQLEREVAELQAKIDRLMLEYCPEEMTEEQMKNWAKHQRTTPANGRRHPRPEGQAVNLPIAKPCPFCGEQPKFSVDIPNDECWLACESGKCEVCPSAAARTPAEVYEKWNTRAI